MTLARNRALQSSACMFAAAFAMHAAPALAQTPIDEEPGQDEADRQTITVTGRRISQSAEAIGEGEVTNTLGITREALLSAPSGISGLKMLETLPGFNVQTDGALGLYEFGNSVQVRAFQLDQIGFIVDGVPLGRSDPFGGSPAFRYVDNENLAVVEASPGASDVSLPSYASLGPIVQYKSITPQQELGIFAAQTFGDDDLKRTFVRLSSGRIGPLRAFVSRTKLDSDLWRGAGSIDREHWEAQIVADISPDIWARLKFVSNDFFDYDSPSLDRATYLSDVPDAGGRTGRDRGYIGVIQDLPETTPGVPYSNPGYTYYYGNAINVRNDQLYAATFHADMTAGAWMETTVYWEDKDGYGVSPDSYSNTLGRYNQQIAAGLPVTPPRGVQYGLSGVGGNRYGITTSLNAEIGAHSLTAGFWAELDKYHRTQLRQNKVGGAPDGAVIEDEVAYFRRDYRSKRETLQLFLSDRISLVDDRLIANLGVKSLSLDYALDGYRDFNDYALSDGSPGFGPQRNTAEYRDHFLPMAGLLFRLPDDRSEIFASYAENYALPRGMDDIYSVATIPQVPQPAPEKAKNAELGIRTNQSQFFAALAGYYTKFDNRIQSISGILPGSGGTLETFYQNVGAVEAYGVEFTGSYKPAFLDGLVYFNANVTYNMAEFKDDLPGIGIDGMRTPDTPKWLVTGGVTVEPASWLVANVSGKYTGRRYTNYINTSTVPSYTVFSGYVDIGEGIALGPLSNIRARINVDNIFDKDVLSFMNPSVTGDGFFRPLSPRTFQFTLSAEL